MVLLAFVLLVSDIEGWGQVVDLTESGGLLCGSGTDGSGGWALGNDIHALDTFITSWELGGGVGNPY